MVFLLRRRSGVAPFGSLQKSSVRSALVLLARAAPRCLKSQKIPVGCIGCSRIQRTFAHFGRRHKAGISWPCSQLLHSLFFFESIRAGAENTGSSTRPQVPCGRRLTTGFFVPGSSVASCRCVFAGRRHPPPAGANRCHWGGRQDRSVSGRGSR